MWLERQAMGLALPCSFACCPACLQSLYAALQLGHTLLLSF